MKGRPVVTSPGGNYLPALDVLASQIRAGDVVAVVIHHDDWCHLLSGRGVCNCNPRIEAQGLTGHTEVEP